MKNTPRTAADFLQVGHWFHRDGCLYEICAWDAETPLKVYARAADTNTIHEFVVTELFAPSPQTRFAATAETLTEIAETTDAATQLVMDSATLPPHLLERATHIIQTVETIQDELARAQQQQQLSGEAVSVTEVLRKACNALPSPIVLSTYYRYYRLYQSHNGDRALIAAALRRKTYGKTQIDANAQHFIDTMLRRFYRSNPPLRAQTVYDIAKQLWHHNQRWWLNYEQTGEQEYQALIERLLDARQEVNDLLADPEQGVHLVQIQLPSRTWFYRYIHWYTSQPDDDTYIVRQGRKAWEANFLLFDRFAQTATLPLQHVFADHYKLDVLHVDDEFREGLGRLWLTVLIDAFSRAVLGFYLAYEDPNIESIQGALQHAIWPKTTLATWGIDLPWDCFGIPQRLSLDNAWTHHSYSLEELTRALAQGGRYTQMELVFRPPYQARYGGLVERLFGNLSGQLRELLPGAILRPDQRHWHNASQGACLLYRDIQRLVCQMLANYLHTPHQELDGWTPHEKWLRGLQLMMPVPPPFTPQLERCFWRLYPDTRMATHSGLALFGLHYWDVGLARLHGRDRQGRKRRFHLRYEPADISRVAVFEEGIWLGDSYARELRLPDGRFEPASLWELQMAKAIARQHSQERLPRPHSWLIHLLEARELIAQRQAEQKQIRRKVQQLRERQRGRPPVTAPDQREALEEAQRQETQQAMGQDHSDDEALRTHLFETLTEVL